MDNLVNISINITNASRRPLRWILLGLAVLLLALVFSGCGGTQTTALPPAAQQNLGTEMAAIERLTPAQMRIVRKMTPAQIELIHKLPPAQLKTLMALPPADVRGIYLGDDTQVIAGLSAAQLTFIEHMNIDQLDAVQRLALAQVNTITAMKPEQRTAFKREAKDTAPALDEKGRQGFIGFWQGYLTEASVIISPNSAQYVDAQPDYERAAQSGSGYGAQARYRLGVLGERNLLGSQSNKVAKTNLQPLLQSRGGFAFTGRTAPVQLWVRTPALAAEGGPATVDGSGAAVLRQEPAAHTSTMLLDSVYRSGNNLDATYYRIVDRYVKAFKSIAPVYGAALSLIMLALIIKLVTTPLTTASFRGMRDMQRVQPLIKELQVKYKDDRAKLAEEQMKIMKEHKVNPMGGCLPMLIQLPIFWVVYRAVQVYAAGFADARFLWISNLANPDTILLILYAGSMIITQMLTATPATDPQQKMMQRQMTFFMPILLFFMLSSVASAFILYWFFLNVFSSLHQYYLVRKFKQEEESAAVIVPAEKPKKGKKS